MSQYFPPYRSPERKIKVEIDLSNYASKTDLKNIIHVDVTSFVTKTNLASLKTEVDKLDIANLTPVPNDLVKLNNVVKNDVVKKTEYNKLVTKVNNIDTTVFILKTKYDTDQSDLEKKISDVDKKFLIQVHLLKKTTDYSSKITEIENKITGISGLATNSALTTVENKIPNVGNLAKEIDYNTNISEIEGKINNHNHEKYITTPEFKNLTAKVFDARLKLVHLATKTNFDTELKKLLAELLQIS